jgi:hypothetical protein
VCVCACVFVCAAGDPAGLVFTLLSGSGIPSFQFPYDSYGLLTMGPTVQDWTLQHCSSLVSEQAVLFQGQWVSTYTGVRHPDPGRQGCRCC